jgi:hypothetical protein
VGPTLVRLYEGTRDEVVDGDDIRNYIESTFNTRTELSGDFWTARAARAEELAPELASIRVVSPLARELNIHPLGPEVDFERRRVRDTGIGSGGVLYDAVRLAALYFSLIPSEERRQNLCHVILTCELFGTWALDDMRWHARVVLLGHPSLISTTGLIEAPAKPREFYLARNAGADEAGLKLAMQGQFIDYGDSRITEVLKGYCAQAALFHLTGEGFCQDPDCRLYNAHWQSELIHAQIESPHEYCENHRKVISRLRKLEVEPDEG